MTNQLGAVIVAAGKGTRMGTKESKQYLLLRDKPILVHTMLTFQKVKEIDEIVLVTGEADVHRCEEWVREYGLTKVRSVIAGGAERQDSVYQGLLALSSEWVLIHDGVRPLVRPNRIVECWQTAVRYGGAVLAVPVKDTIKAVDSAGMVVHTPDRKTLWAIQTPQGFRRTALLMAHELAAAGKVLGTDDSMLAEQAGIPVHVVEGDYTNVKITTPDDLEWAEWFLGRTT